MVAGAVGGGSAGLAARVAGRLQTPAVQVSTVQALLSLAQSAAVVQASQPGVAGRLQTPAVQVSTVQALLSLAQSAAVVQASHPATTW